jgi:hypothetical protein
LGLQGDGFLEVQIVAINQNVASAACFNSSCVDRHELFAGQEVYLRRITASSISGPKEWGV